MLLVILVMTGCESKEGNMDAALQLRTRIANSGCSFTARITADYGDSIYTFRMHCEYDRNGDLLFRVEAPATIAGISGKISAASQKVAFTDMALAFDLLADGQLSPVSAPFIMMKALHSGYLTSCGQDGAYQRVSLRDSYREDALMLDVWLDREYFPVQAEILFDGRRILTIYVEDFSFL